MEINVINSKMETIEKIDVPDVISGAKPNEALIYELVRQHQAGARQGTAATKNRALVSGSGRKLWKQKGTGRARIGSIRSPLWRHGGTVFGPQPRDYSYPITAKKRLAGLRSVLAQKMKKNQIYVLDEISFESAKTKAALELLKLLQLPAKTLFVDSPRNNNLRLSVRNLPDVKFSSVKSFNIVDALKYNNMVISKPAFIQLARILSK